MNLKLKTVATINISDLAPVVNQAFTDYIGGKVMFNPDSFLRFVYREGIDLSMSHVALHDDKIIGFALVGRQGWTSRLATMGVMPHARGQGAGRWLLSQVIEEADIRGDHTVVLEVFEQNTNALKLYEQAGFETVRRLFGYTAQHPPGVAAAELEEIDVFEVARVLMADGCTTLPWQIAGPSIARLGPPYRGHRLGPAYTVISDPGSRMVVLRTFMVEPSQRQQGYGRRLFQALWAHYPEKTWTIPALCPEEYGSSFMERVGFQPARLNQFQMALALS